MPGSFEVPLMVNSILLLLPSSCFASELPSGYLIVIFLTPVKMGVNLFFSIIRVAVISDAYAGETKLEIKSAVIIPEKIVTKYFTRGLDFIWFIILIFSADIIKTQYLSTILFDNNSCRRDRICQTNQRSQQVVRGHDDNFKRRRQHLALWPVRVP